MSIIIKGVDLPSKVDLDYHDNHLVLGGICYALDVDQLVQIPKKHGDLIDRNQVFTYSHRDVQNLEEVPVILEGEHE